MKPFTSKHCTQYLTKSSPLNQGLILPGQTQEDVARGVKKAREAGLIGGPNKEKTTNTTSAPAGFSRRYKEDKLAKAAVAGLKAGVKAGFKKGSQANKATLEKMSSTKYKK
jgi:hypothetical protein